MKKFIAIVLVLVVTVMCMARTDSAAPIFVEDVGVVNAMCIEEEYIDTTSYMDKVFSATEPVTEPTEPVPEPCKYAPGLYEASFTNESGKVLNYNVFIPEGATKNMPVIVWMHGLYQVTAPLAVNYGPIKCAQELGEDRFIIIQPHARSAWHTNGQMKLTMELVNYAIEEYELDENRVILSGYSLGSIGAWYYADQSDMWAAAIPISNRATVNMKNLADSDMPIWAFYSTWDTSENRSDMKRTVEKFQEINPDRDVRLTVIEKVSHSDMAHAPWTTELFDWAAAQTK